MLGFFVVRRLIELHKVSSVTRERRLQVFSCPSRGKLVHRGNNHRLDELYDLENERLEKRRPQFLSNQFIHAYTSFVTRDATRNWSDIYIASDFDRNELIWRVPISEVRSFFMVSSADYPQEMHMKFNAQKGGGATMSLQTELPISPLDTAVTDKVPCHGASVLCAQARHYTQF